jgi:hypothetical protein
MRVKSRIMNKATDFLDFASFVGIDRRKINGRLEGARNMTMLGLIGAPRGTYDAECRQPTNPHIAAMMETADFGPFKATGLRPAIRSLKAIMADIRAECRVTYDLLGSAGMLCCRLVRGSATAISNHSWGAAIDLTIAGQLDPLGDERTQRGLLEIYPIFNRHGFFWGAAFAAEDAMHFEASDQLIRKWASDGEFGVQMRGVPTALCVGDRGLRIETLQLALNRALSPMSIEVDGIMGKETRAMLIEFQRRKGLPIDGFATHRVRVALGMS